MRAVVDHLRGPADERAGRQALRYLVVGGCGYVLAVAAYALLVAVGVPPYPAVVAVFVLNGVFNFAMVRLWAFPPSGRAPHGDLVRFCAVAGGSLAINYASFALLYSAIGLPAAVAQALAIAIAAPFGFLANRRWSFGSPDA